MKPPRVGEGRLPPRITSLDVGVESIARWRVDDEQHLPRERGSPRFIPDPGQLDDILRRPSLDERLPNLLRPDTLDPDLLHPPVLAAARETVADRFRQLAATSAGSDRDVFRAAADVLEGDAMLDREIRTALAALLRG